MRSAVMSVLQQYPSIPTTAPILGFRIGMLKCLYETQVLLIHHLSQEDCPWLPESFWNEETTSFLSKLGMGF